MLERLSRNHRNLALAGLGLILIWSSWTVRAVLNPVILGYLLAFVLNPMVRGLEARGWGRRSAANLIFLGFFLGASILGLIVFVQGRALAADVGRSDQFQAGLGQLENIADDWLRVGRPAEDDPAPADGEGPDGSLLVAIPGASLAGSSEEAPLVEGPLVPGGATTSTAGPMGSESGDLAVLERLLDRLGEGQGQARAIEGAATIWPYLRSFFGSMIALVTLLTLLPIYAYFLLFELDRIHSFVHRYVPRSEKQRIARIGRQIGEVLANFFRGRLLICVVKGICLTVGLAIAQVPYAVFLGMGSGFLSLVPFVGPVMGFSMAFLLAAFPPGLDAGLGGAPGLASLGLALGKTGGVFLAVELLEGYVLLPKILGDSLGLHPVVVLASIFIGGAALGMFGFLIALPLTAALVIIGRELVLPALAAFADEPPGLAGAGDGLPTDSAG